MWLNRKAHLEARVGLAGVCPTEDDLIDTKREPLRLQNLLNSGQSDGSGGTTQNVTE